MPKLVIKLKRWSVEEIEPATGRKWNEGNSGNKKKERKQKKSSRIPNNEKIENSNKENDEAGINCRKKIKVKKLTRQIKGLDQTERRNVGISNKNVAEKNCIVIDERIDIRE